MQSVAGQLVFSPSDLNHFLECEHLIQLERNRGERPRQPRDAHAELLAAKGLEHEGAWLARFRAEGRRIVEIDSLPGERNWDRDAARTLAAMREGADVIYQGVLAEDDWHGISDFLIRTETPSSLGGWSYEAWDTKLARHSKPYFILQLCFYSGQLARAQGSDPAHMHVILGTGDADHFRYADFAAYYRAVRRHFLDIMRTNRPTSPYPVAHCALCEYEHACDEQWEAEDHLSLVAGISRAQVQRLNDIGVQTVAQLAALDAAVPVKIGRAALDRLRHQAMLQTQFRRTGKHRFDLLPLDERSGFRLLPAPSAGDVYFDMEGDPYFEPGYGLEYLFGAVTTDGGASKFQAFQALDRKAEKVAFEQFIDFVHARLVEWPDLHVYHYAPYEVTALKRLMSEHSTREDEVDDLLRREVFVDLYQVVRQSLRISHPSYSIKKVRTFFMEGAGQGIVSDGADSILEFERWRVSGDPAILDAIVTYNEEDCVSTVKLHEWLLEQKRDAEKSAGAEIPWKGTDPPKDNPKRAEEDALTARRREQLAVLGSPAARVLGPLLNYHRREAKPEWWAYFDRQKKSLDDLLLDTQAIAYLRPVDGIAPEPVQRSLVYTLEFPDQEFKLGADAQIEDPFRRESAGTIAWIDEENRRLGLKRGLKRSDEPLPSAIAAGNPLDTKSQRAALGRVADAVIAEGTGYSAARALLARDLPSVRGREPGAVLQTLDLGAQKALVAALDSSYLFIQGPPGSGKTWTGARMIVSLISQGRRVGVAANSHKAINNLLTEVEKVATAEGVTFQGLKKGSDDDAFGGEFIKDTDDNEECETSDAALIAGTSWLFTRPRMDQRLDYLFIDEAGQVSLADAVAMCTAARNLVLLGDPQQLPQVVQGVHPDGSGCSVLEHLLGETATVSEDRGLFLAQTWRMHPDICRFISDLAYDGRLASAPGRERQRVDVVSGFSRTERRTERDSNGLTGTGLRLISVEHDGNAQRSPEEAAAVAAQVRLLLAGGTFTDDEGRTRPLRPADILVVAPYNMQVRCLRDVLPDGVQAGTVDKFQGREAPVVFFSMASSTGEDVPRGLEFLFSRNRFNVAISRARALAIVVCSPRLLDVRCSSIEQMRLVNTLCAFAESALRELGNS